MRRAVHKRISQGISVAACLILLATAAQSERLPLKSYTTVDGLPHNTIHKIVRDTRGFLWFCTAEGLSRFDGYSFTNYTTDDGLPHQNITDFLETRSGEFWIGTSAGLVRFDPKGTPTNRVIDANEAGQSSPMFTVVIPSDENRQAKAITVVIETRDGTIWCGTMRQLYRLERSNDRFELVRTELGDLRGSQEGFYILDLLEDRHGSLWVAGFSWLCRRWPDGGTACYSMPDGLPDRNFHDLFEDHQGGLWAATRGHGFFKFTADQTHAAPVVLRTYSREDGLGTIWVNQLFETSDHRFWVATDTGVAEFFPEAGKGEPNFKTYTQANGLLYYGINALNEDAGDNLWLASNVGAMKLASQGFLSTSEQDGVLGVSAIFGDNAGDVCFRASLFGDAGLTVFEGAKSDLLHPPRNHYARFGCFDGTQFTWLKPDVLTNDQLGWVGEMVTLQAHNGEWWFGTAAGLYRFPAFDNLAELKRARPLAVYTTKDALTASQVFRIFEDSQGNIWVSAIQPNGLARWERASSGWRDLTNSEHLPSANSDLARSFGEDREGNIWIGFSTGVARYRDGRLVFFDANDGMPPGAIQNIHLDRAGRLWLASARSGLIRVDDPSAEHPAFTAYTTAQGLSSNTAEGITEDLQGYIYVGTGHGLDRLDPATGHLRHFTTADGLAPGRVVAGFRDATGALWFGTEKGMSRFFPESYARSISPAPILITGLTVAGEQQRVSALGETEINLPDLAPSRNQIQINFVGLSFASGEVLRYQYKLEGANADWSAPIEHRSINYDSLSPGRYRFLVRAINSEGVVSSTPATISFTVLRPIWQRWWFIILAAMSIGLVAYLLYRNRVARIVEVANVRTRIATDLHDDIGANLTRIAILSEVAHQRLGHLSSEEDDLLPSIADISRESVSAMSDIVWAINPKKDTLANLTRRMRQHASEILEQRDIQLHFHAPAGSSDLRLDANMRRSIYLIFKEVLNNVVRHARASVVRVELKIAESEFVMSIADNGAGFDTLQEYDGNGLLSMKKRAAEVSGRLDVTSTTSEGTLVLLRVPL